MVTYWHQTTAGYSQLLPEHHHLSLRVDRGDTPLSVTTRLQASKVVCLQADRKVLSSTTSPSSLPLIPRSSYQPSNKVSSIKTMASITPSLCSKLAALNVSSKHVRPTNRVTKPTRKRRARQSQTSSPNIFSSALKPMCPLISQRRFNMMRACPATGASDVALLRVRPFCLAADINQRRQQVDEPVTFNDISSSSRHSPSRDLISNTGNAPTTLTKADRQLKRHSLPFNEDNDLDPWMLFPKLQWPHSAQKNDSVEYQRQSQEARLAKEQDLRVRGSPLNFEQLKDLCHMTLNLGKYSQELPPTTTISTTPQSISKRSFDPMDLDD